MFGNGHTYFADSPVIIDISGLQWPGSSPFNIVRVNIVYDGKTIGNFYADTGGQTSISFDISSALRTIWSGYQFDAEVSKANNAATDTATSSHIVQRRYYRAYSLEVLTEYIDSHDGELVQTSSGIISGGKCSIGHLTEWERNSMADQTRADLSHWEHTNLRNGDASNKPTDSPERVGKDSITSWVDVSNAGTQSIFYSCHTDGENDNPSAHAPLVLRDSQVYVDFLFLNHRGAVETCSGLTKEAMNIDIEVEQHARTERPLFIPSHSLMAIGTDGRRSWQMSSGFVTREWAEWWAMEFLGGKRKQWWMKYKGRYVPVIVTPAKKSTTIYDRTKQQMPHVEFTVTLGLEG